MYDLQTIRDRCNVLMSAAVISEDKKRLSELVEAKEFLEKDNCFACANKLKSILILCDLGYNVIQSSEIYKSFNNVAVISGFLEYKDNNGDLVQIETILSPSVEDYYKFSNNLIFKYNKKNNNFYSLVNGKWVYDADLERKFYDSSYDYKRINYKIIKKDSPRR